MRPHLLVDPVPGKQGSLNTAQVGEQVLDLIELVFVGTEGTLSKSTAPSLWLVSSCERMPVP